MKTDKEKIDYVCKNSLPRIHKDCGKILRDAGLPMPSAKDSAHADEELIKLLKLAGLLDLLVGYESDET
jgi:hypothetical protein